MKIIGCDFHPSWQQVAWLDAETGETGERKLVNGDGEAERFYRGLAEPALVGVEACGNSQWFLELLQQLGHEVWVGDAAQIRASYVRKQKTDKRDAAHILKLLVEGRFPRLWVPIGRAAGCAAVADSSAQAGGDSDAGEERVAAPGDESRDAEEEQAVERGGTESVARVAAGRLGGVTAAQDLLGLLKSLDEQIGAAGPGGGRRSSERQNGAVVEDAAGSGSDHGAGVCGDHRRCHALSARQAGGQLSGADSARAQLGRTAAAGCDQQAGQPVSAHVAGGSGAQRQPAG